MGKGRKYTCTEKRLTHISAGDPHLRMQYRPVNNVNIGAALTVLHFGKKHALVSEGMLRAKT